MTEKIDQLVLDTRNNELDPMVMYFVARKSKP